MKIRNILIVDDDPEDSDFFSLVIKQLYPDVQVQIATSREELFANLKKEKPDLLFLDSFIRHHSGVASLSEIRNDKGLKDLPVIMYTGSEDQKNIQNAFDAGASAYIVKPASLKEIRMVLQQVLNQNWQEEGRPRQVYKDSRFRNYE